MGKCGGTTGAGIGGIGDTECRTAEVNCIKEAELFEEGSLRIMYWSSKMWNLRNTRLNVHMYPRRILQGRLKQMQILTEGCQASNAKNLGDIQLLLSTSFRRVYLIHNRFVRTPKLTI